MLVFNASKLFILIKIGGGSPRVEYFFVVAVVVVVGGGVVVVVVRCGLTSIHCHVF